MTAQASLISAPVGWAGVLTCEAERLAGAIRITVAALMVVTVMLAFRMPFLAIGPYLVFILSQRDMLLTRAAAILAVLVGMLATFFVYLVVLLSWDVAWLRVALLIGIFFGGYYFMRILAEPRIVLGALVVLALFAADFDTVPLPNVLLSQLGWIWAIFGLIFVATFLTQWLLGAPSGLGLLRGGMRRILIETEAVCLQAARGRKFAAATFGRDREDMASRIRMLAATRGIGASQAARCLDVLEGCAEVLAAAADRGPSLTPKEKLRWLAAASWLRRLRMRVLRGGELPSPPAQSPVIEADGRLAQLAVKLGQPEEVTMPKQPSLVPADWLSNPAYASFATRASLATMTCYVFMTLVDWGDIHTCMITCVVTALAVAGERSLKQQLRIGGAVVGGVLGIGAVVFLIPRFASFAALLFLLAGGTMLAAWVSLGGKRIAYAGWQMALAFYMTILQEPHPVTKLDAIWDRWVGIVIGIAAMRAAFAFPALTEIAAGDRRVPAGALDTNGSTEMGAG